MQVATHDSSFKLIYFELPHDEHLTDPPVNAQVKQSVILLAQDLQKLVALAYSDAAHSSTHYS